MIYVLINISIFFQRQYQYLFRNRYRIRYRNRSRCLQRYQSPNTYRFPQPWRRSFTWQCRFPSRILSLQRGSFTWIGRSRCRLRNRCMFRWIGRYMFRYRCLNHIPSPSRRSCTWIGRIRYMWLYRYTCQNRIRCRSPYMRTIKRMAGDNASPPRRYCVFIAYRYLIYP